MKTLPSQVPSLIFPLIAAALIAALLAPAPSRADSHFVHEATNENTFLHVTQLDHPSINGNPFVRILIQQAFNPGGGSGVDQATYFGVSYSSSAERWSIETQDLSVPLTVGLKFFVFVSAQAIVHDATAPNTSSNATELDHPSANGNDYGFWSATYFRTRDGSSGPRNPHPIAMEYDDTAERWTLVNQDFETLPSGGGFFVDGSAEDSGGVISIPPLSVRHDTVAIGILGPATYMDIEEINDRPDAMFLATLDASNGMFNPHPTAVAYNADFGRWNIYNVDGAPMPEGVVFMVNILPVLVFEDGFESGGTDAWSVSVP